MKKLNRKGFTLIELLAVIVLLAILMVVALPAVLDVLSTAPQKQFKNSADAIEKWVSDEYALASLGTASSSFTAICGARGATCKTTTTIPLSGSDAAKGTAFLTAAGQKASNYASVTVQVQDNGRVCVKITAPANSGDFAGVAAVSSNGCPAA